MEKWVQGLSSRLRWSTCCRLCGLRVSAITAASTSWLPPKAPSPVWRSSHCAMSRAEELIEPAGAMLSTLSWGMGTIASPARPWGVATFSAATSSAKVVLLRFIPRGLKKRCAMNSSQLRPVTTGTISPAVRNIRFE